MKGISGCVFAAIMLVAVAGKFAGSALTAA